MIQPAAGSSCLAWLNETSIKLAEQLNQSISLAWNDSDARQP